jgi:hypothetical protein
MIFYDTLMEKRANAKAALQEAVDMTRIHGPTGRYILGGALGGGLAGRYAGDEENRTRNTLIGAATGGFLGAGASDLHKALIVRGLKKDPSKGRMTGYYNGDAEGNPILTGLTLRKSRNPQARVHMDTLTDLDPKKGWDELPGYQRAGYMQGAEVFADDPLGDLDQDDLDLFDMVQKREALRGARNLAIGSALGGGEIYRQRKKRREEG